MTDIITYTKELDEYVDTDGTVIKTWVLHGHLGGFTDVHSYPFSFTNADIDDDLTYQLTQKGYTGFDVVVE